MKSHRRFPFFRRTILASIIGVASLQFSLSSSFADAPTTVAAGDVTQTSAVLWAHSSNIGPVSWEYTTDPTFATGITPINTVATNTLVPVKASVTGLAPATQYYYRVTTVTDVVTGTFRTPAAAGLNGLHFGVSGDQRGELAPFPSLSNVPSKNLEFFLQFGDNIYADVASPDVPVNQAHTLAEYRAKHKEIYSSRYGLNTFADLRASTAVLAVIDDHEVTNDFSGAALRTSDPRFSADTGTLINETETFANGVRAYLDYMPVNEPAYTGTGDTTMDGRVKMYRFNTYGRDAATFVLDARSFRSDALPAVSNPNNPAQVGAFLAGSFTPGRTLLGSAQFNQLKADLLAAQAAGTMWKFVFCPEPVQNFGALGGEDRYEGYAAERTALLKFIDDNHIPNVVFVTADFHGTVVNRLSYQLAPFQSQIQTNSIEIITGPVAYDKPFGPAIVDLGTAFGLVSPAQNAFYNSLGNGPLKESFVLSIVNGGLAPLGYNQVPLFTNPLPNVQLVSGTYPATNSYGWTEFTIDPSTQQLDVKTWGILPYSKAQLDGLGNTATGGTPDAAILARTPAVQNEFTITPKAYLSPAATAGLTVVYPATLDLLAATGAPAGSTFSGPGVSGSTFDPAGLGSGVKTISYSTTDAFGTTLTNSFTITVQSVAFTGVAAGDATTADAIVWTRAVDTSLPAAATTLTAQVSTSSSFTSPVTLTVSTDPAADFTAKLDFASLTAGTQYYYRFVGPGGETSGTGKFKTAPTPSTAAPLHFAFSGDNDGLIRPYALASTIPAQNLDFYVNLGDTIYENASNLTTSGAHNGASWLNSPSVTLSNDSLSFNGIPRAFIPAGTPFATQAQLRADYAKKYRENFLPVNTGGQASLKDLYAAQGNYTTWDNHELGNRKYIDGGAPAGGSVGGAAGTDMATGRGVDARNNVGGNIGNGNDAADLFSPSALAALGGWMNRAPGFLALEDVFLAYMPIANRGIIAAPTDPRTDGTRQLYSAQQWGKNALFINVDGRSYRDIRIKAANAGADETTAPRANNPDRTFLGKTQLAWLKQTLLAAQTAGVPWKFVSIDDPIDQIGPIGGALTLTNLPSFGTGSTYSPVNADGGKSFIGGYRAERNALLKWIADNHVTNVVFLGTDDHQNRINELTYSPTGQTEVQSSYVKVPACFSIICGPLGATGPDLITNHTFAMAQQLANSIATAQQTAGVEPLGLAGYPGLKNLVRENDATAATNPQPVDFYSPDTFNYTVLDVSADGKTLTVSSIGMDATAQNAGIEYAAGPQARTIFSFQIDAAADSTAAVAANVTITRGGFVLDRRTNRFVQQVTIRNTGATPVSGAVAIALDGLSGNATLATAAGVTSTLTPAGSPLALVNVGADNALTPGETATVTLEFNNPTRAAITYTPRALGNVKP